MFDDELKQLDHEIRRHLALADLTEGVIRAEHINAAKVLQSLREQIGGALQRQELRSANATVLRLMPFFRKKKASSAGKKSRES